MRYGNEYLEDIEEVVQLIPDLRSLFNHKILITGGTGMIGSSVVELLLGANKMHNAGIQIYLACRNKQRAQKRFVGFPGAENLHYLEFDAIADKAPNEAFDEIIYGASNAHPYLYVKQPVETMLGNLIGLNAMLRQASTNGTGRFLYISSSEVYGKKDSLTEPYSEESYGIVDNLSIRAAYPNSKRAAETLCMAYADEYGVDSVIVRPGHIYGPTITDSDSRASADFSRRAASRQDIVLKSSGSQLRSYTYTLDCASAILMVLMKGDKKNAYNISNPKSICSIRDIAGAFAEAGKVKIVFEDPSDAEKNGFNLMDNSSLTSDKLEALGWHPAFDLKRGCARTIQCLREKN
jgi:nucleoside-diphosphate-sugar epimerase